MLMQWAPKQITFINNKILRIITNVYKISIVLNGSETLIIGIKFCWAFEHQILIGFVKSLPLYEQKLPLSCVYNLSAVLFRS